jgi:hypothetical protein
MLWLMITILWSLQVLFGGATAASPVMRILWYLIVLLGVLHILVTAIEIMEFVLAISYLGGQTIP